MKLIRFGENGRGKPGILLPDGRRINARGEFRHDDEVFSPAAGFFGFGIEGFGGLAPRAVASHGS